MHFNFLFPTTRLHHATACLIQGLHGLGHSISANYIPDDPKNVMSNGILPPFFKLKPNYISVTQNFSGENIIVELTNGAGNLGTRLETISRQRKVIAVSMHDEVNFIPVSPSLYLFQGHYNSFAQRHGHNFPLAFGLSQEIVDYAEQHQPQTRKRAILHNFRPSANQCVRGALDLSLVPNLQKIIEVNRSFSSPSEYVNQLASHQAVLCYGGMIYDDLRQNLNMFPNQTSPEAYNYKNFPNHPVVFRFDSWRFYEAAIFGAAPITLNFEKYGLETGANPRPWIEYIPVEFDKVESLPTELAQRLKDDPDFLIKVGQNARRWALANHSPTATAQRFLNKLKEINIL